MPNLKWKIPDQGIECDLGVLVNRSPRDFAWLRVQGKTSRAAVQLARKVVKTLNAEPAAPAGDVSESTLKAYHSAVNQNLMVVISCLTTLRPDEVLRQYRELVQIAKDRQYGVPEAWAVRTLRARVRRDNAVMAKAYRKIRL